MARRSKRIRGIMERVEAGKYYTIDAALKLLQECSSVKFSESVEVAVHLGVDARKSDQMVRGAIVLPQGTGKKVRVAVIAQGDDIEVAQKAGADVAGFTELLEQIQGGNFDYDVVVATPNVMPDLSKLGKILGPKGLMPNPKVGTVTTDVGQAVRNAKSGQVRYRTDKNGIINCAVGKVSFEVAALLENIRALLSELKRVKPSAAKGIYLNRIYLSTTMGPGLAIDQNSIWSTN